MYLLYSPKSTHAVLPPNHAPPATNKASDGQEEPQSDSRPAPHLERRLELNNAICHVVVRALVVNALLQAACVDLHALLTAVAALQRPPHGTFLLCARRPPKHHMRPRQIDSGITLETIVTTAVFFSASSPITCVGLVESAAVCGGDLGAHSSKNREMDDGTSMDRPLR